MKLVNEKICALQGEEKVETERVAATHNKQIISRYEWIARETLPSPEKLSLIASTKTHQLAGCHKLIVCLELVDRGC